MQLVALSRLDFWIYISGYHWLILFQSHVQHCLDVLLLLKSPGNLVGYGPFRIERLWTRLMFLGWPRLKLNLLSLF